MRCLLLAVVAGLAVLSVQILAEDVAIVDDFEIDDSTLRQMLGDLFEFDESDDLGIDRDARARGGDDVTGAEEEKAIAVDPKEQARFNSFIDTFLRRLNSFARSRFDPLSVGLGKKGKSSSKGGTNKKGKNAKSGDKKGNKAGKKGKKGEKKDGRHPRDLDLGEVDQEAVVDVEEEEEVHEVEKREAEFEVVEIEEEEEEETDLEEKEDEAEEESLVRVARDADEETDDSPMEETSRQGKPAKGSKKGAAKKGGKKGGKKGKGKKKSGKKGGKKSGKKSGKKGGTGGKKKGKHPKDLDDDEVVQEGEEAVVDVEEKEEEGHEVEKREAELEVNEIEEEEEEDDEAEEESLVRVARDVDEETDDSPMEETSRKGKPAKGNNKGATKKGGKKSGKKGKGKSKSGKKGGNKSAKKSGKNSAKNKSGPRTSRADVSGIATLRRDGDVLVRNNKGGKEMRATFTMGPVQLKVNRKFGSGKKAISREAAAISPELTGKLAIVVAANGKARMTNFRINRPAIVQVQGTLTKTAQGSKSNNNFMENSIGRFSPIAAKKLKLASREILSAGEPKANADN